MKIKVAPYIEAFTSPKYLRLQRFMKIAYAQLERFGWGSESFSDILGEIECTKRSYFNKFYVVWIEHHCLPVAVLVLEDTYIATIYVRKSFRAKGLLRRMLEYCMIDLGKKTLGWDVSYCNDSAIEAYNRITGQEGPNNCKEDCYVLRRNDYFHRKNNIRPKNRRF